MAGIAVSSIIGGIVAGIGTATSGGSVGEIIASTVIGACTAGGIATVAAVGATLGATAGTVALTSAAIGAAGEIISLSVEHGFHKDDTDYSFNLVSAITRTIYAAGVSALGGAASYGLNMIYPGTEEIIGFGISAETALSLGLVDYSSRQIITSISTSP